MSTARSEHSYLKRSALAAALMTTALLFVLWGTGFIYRVSVVAIDGTRYFCLIDDAMISMRYAWNLTHGIGLVWNAGERVEGYSNLLMVLLMAIPSAFLDKSAAVLAVQLAGIFTMLGNAWLSMKIFRMITRKSQERRADAFQVVAFAMPLLYYPLVFWTLMGMETGLLALLLYWAIYASLRFRMDGIHRELWWSSLALGLAYLTRNDSLIFALLVFGFMWNPGRKTWRAGLRALLPGGVVYGGFIAVQALFRYLYYGSIMPNTYFLKLVGMPLLARLENGAGFLTPFLGEVAFLLTAGMLSAIWRPSLQKAYLSAFLLAALAYEMYAGGDYYNYWRFMAPAIPLVIVVVLHALGDALARRPVWKLSGSQRAALNRPSPGWQRAGVLAVVMLLVISANRRFLGEAMLPPSLDAGARDYVNLAVAIRAATTPDATVGVVRAGIIPYYTGRKAVDFLGKNDPYIAHLPPDLSGQINWFGMYSVSGHNKYDLEYSIKQRLPTYVEGFEWGAQNLNDWAATHYVLVKYKGMRLDLLRNSADVRWDQVQFMTRDKKNQGN